MCASWTGPEPSRRAPSVLAPRLSRRDRLPDTTADRGPHLSAQDHARPLLLAGLRRGDSSCCILPRARAPATLRYTVLSRPPGGECGKPNATILLLSTGVTICKFATDAEAAQHGPVICPRPDYRRDDPTLAVRASGPRAGGSIQVTRTPSSTGHPITALVLRCPIRNPDPRYKYWLHGLKSHLYKNCIIGRADALTSSRRQADARPLRADPNQLLPPRGLWTRSA